MNFVHVNGAKLMALGTIAAKNLFNLAVQKICWNLLGNAEEISVRSALIVAEALFARTHATDDYGRAAVATLRHKPGLDCGRHKINVDLRIGVSQSRRTS